MGISSGYLGARFSVSHEAIAQSAPSMDGGVGGASFETNAATRAACCAANLPRGDLVIARGSSRVGLRVHPFSLHATERPGGSNAACDEDEKPHGCGGLRVHSACNDDRPKNKDMAIAQKSSLFGAAEACEARGALPLRSMSLELPQMPRRAPRGRPPKGYIWCSDRYVHHESLVPYSHDEHEKAMLGVWRQMRLQRYQEDVRGCRTRRVEAQASARVRKGRKPRRQKLKNATFARSSADEVN